MSTEEKSVVGRLYTVHEQAIAKGLAEAETALNEPPAHAHVSRDRAIEWFKLAKLAKELRES